MSELGQRTHASRVRPGAANNGTTWGYDDLGQLIKADDDATTPVPADRGYLYDTNGNNPGIQAPANATHIGWDAENRLISCTIGTTTINYEYDHLSRLVVRKEDTTISRRYIYDGWSRIAEYDGAGVLQDTFTWGLDLSGTMQGAGGVGGLLAVRQGGVSYYPAYDGNGNISEYLDVDGDVAAHFEYDPFGNTTVSSDEDNFFTYRFSTKPVDLVTGWFYYGYRWLDPLTGRWPSRDPIEEQGGVNLYGFVGNGGANSVDNFGLEAYVERAPGEPANPLAPNDRDSRKGGGFKSRDPIDIENRVVTEMSSKKGIAVILVLRMKYPNAVRHLAHYFGKSGDKLRINEPSLLATKGGSDNLTLEFNDARSAAERIGASKNAGEEFRIGASKWSGGKNTPETSMDWFLASGGFRGAGYATVCKNLDGTFTMDFVWKYADEYNWNFGNSIRIPDGAVDALNNGGYKNDVKEAVTRGLLERRDDGSMYVKDSAMRGFHLAGLAREFEMWGRQKIKRVTWRPGETPTPELLEGD